MPAYSFKERFVPMILDGTKAQTIRNKRKGQAKPGSTLYLFFGLRTKWCKRLLETPCTEVKEIIITKNGNVFVAGKKLSKVEKDILAWEDGFRHDNKLLFPGCFEIMFRFWNQTHDLPFKGDIIYW